jgi:hypothetical protein
VEGVLKEIIARAKNSVVTAVLTDVVKTYKDTLFAFLYDHIFTDNNSSDDSSGSSSGYSLENASQRGDLGLGPLAQRSISATKKPRT